MNRIINIIMTELAADILKHEEAMESAINNKSLEIQDRVEAIKHHLSKVIETEMMIEKWRNYTTQVNNND